MRVLRKRMDLHQGCWVHVLGDVMTLDLGCDGNGLASCYIIMMTNPFGFRSTYCNACMPYASAPNVVILCLLVLKIMNVQEGYLNVP